MNRVGENKGENKERQTEIDTEEKVLWKLKTYLTFEWRLAKFSPMGKKSSISNFKKKIDP